MKKGIIHLSDLHITEHHNDDGDIINTSWFVSHSTEFYETVIKKIKDIKVDLSIEKYYLVITGDLSNKSEKEEYDKTIDFLEKAIRELEIDKKNTLIIPGNHDINWYENEKAVKSNKANPKKSWQYNEEKFLHYKEFYDTLFKDIHPEFNCEDIITNIIPINNTKILLIGLNSVLQSSYIEKEFGDFDTKTLDEELEKKLIGYEDYEKIVLFHHNPKFNKKGGTPSLRNWDNKKIIFEKHNIKTFLFGHEHTYGSKRDDAAFCNYIATGSLGINKAKVDNYLNVIEIIETNDCTKLKTNFYKLEKNDKEGLPDFGFWVNVKDPTDSNELLIFENKSIIPKSNPILPNLENGIQRTIVQIPTTIEENKFNYSNDLVEFVKSKKAFKSGHFHWSENAKAHNWIDIPSLLNSREVIMLCQKALVNVISENKINTELFIGIGMEGSFLGSSVALQLNTAYTFLPYEYRYKDHDDYEKKLNHSAVNNVTIITDVVHSGTTISKLLELEKDFFTVAKTITLLTLFYTGKKEYSVDMFKKEIDPKINFYHICSKIKVESCPYSDDFNEKCTVYKEKLENVYEFYSKDKKNR